MHYRVNAIVAVLALAVALPGSASALTEIEEQRSVILDCKRARGIGGAAWIEQRPGSTASSAMQVQIAPYDRVTAPDAQTINACAANRLGLSAAEFATSTRNRTVVRSVRAPYGYRGIDCGPYPSILYKGDLYCQWEKR